MGTRAIGCRIVFRFGSPRGMTTAPGNSSLVLSTQVVQSSGAFSESQIHSCIHKRGIRRPQLVSAVVRLLWAEREISRFFCALLVSSGLHAFTVPVCFADWSCCSPAQPVKQM